MRGNNLILKVLYSSSVNYTAIDTFVWYSCTQTFLRDFSLARRMAQVSS